MVPLVAVRVAPLYHAIRRPEFDRSLLKVREYAPCLALFKKLVVRDEIAQVFAPPRRALGDDAVELLCSSVVSTVDAVIEISKPKHVIARIENVEAVVRYDFARDPSTISEKFSARFLRRSCAPRGGT